MLAPASLPNRRFPALMLLVLATACGCGEGSADPTKLEAHVVKGVVRDTNGDPLPNVPVRAHDSLENFSYVTGMSDAEGRYRIALDPDRITTYWISAEHQVEWDGQQWKIQLVPDASDPFPAAAGAIRNFDWKLTMSTEADHNLNVGGLVSANFEAHDWGKPGAETELVELHFVPSGPRIDGSQGEALTAMVGSDALKSVPLGRYTVTARGTGEVTAPITLKVDGSDADFAASVETGFVSEAGFGSLDLVLSID